MHPTTCFCATRLLLKVTSTTLYLFFFLEIIIQMTKLIYPSRIVPCWNLSTRGLRGQVSWRLSPCRQRLSNNRQRDSFLEVTPEAFTSQRVAQKPPSSKPSSQVETDVPGPGQFFLLVLFGDSSQKPNKQRGGGKERRGGKQEIPGSVPCWENVGGRAHKSLMAQH